MSLFSFFPTLKEGKIDLKFLNLEPLILNFAPEKMKKKREFQSSELVKSFAKIYGFEDKLLAIEVKDFLEEYLDESLFREIVSVNLKDKILFLKINSPLLKNDFRMRKSFFLKKFREKFGEDHFSDLQVL